MRAVCVIACALACGCNGRDPAPATMPTMHTARPAPTQVNSPILDVDAGAKYSEGGIVVEVVSAKAGPVMVKNLLGQEQPSPNSYLAVTVRLTNTDPNKKADYRSWSYGPNALRAAPSVADQNGNSYKFTDPGINDVVGQVGRAASLYPDKPVTDLILFEPPLASATSLALKLPLSAVGREGYVAFRLKCPH